MANPIITGVHLHHKDVEWTSVRRKKGGVELLERQRVVLDMEAEKPDFSAPETSLTLKKQCHQIKGLICLSLPTDQVLLRVAILPTDDEEEIQGMVELQVDKFSPFPIEHMAVAHEMLDQHENESRVLIAAVRNDLVETLGLAFTRAGLLPHWMDVDILAWWFLLREHGKIPNTGRHTFFIMDEDSAELVVVQDELPVIFRSLGPHRGLNDPEEIEELAEEISFILTSLEAEWGAGGSSRMSVWSNEPASLDFVTTLSEECGMDVEVHDLNELPALSEGMARRSLRKGAAKLNLAPTNWLEKERSRHITRVLLMLTALFLGLWLSVIGVGVALFKVQDGAYTKLQAEYAGLSAAAKRVKEIQANVNSLKQYANRSHSSLESLREITIILPPGVELTSYTYKKGKQVVLRGSAESETPIFNFIEAMEKTELFSEVKTEGIASRRVRGQPVTEFKIVATLPGGEGEES